jgi:hypothetical protein
MGEQPNPWDLLQPQDATIRHRGAKPPRRCGKSAITCSLDYTFISFEMAAYYERDRFALARRTSIPRR